MIKVKLKELKRGDCFRRIYKSKLGYTKLTYEKIDYCEQYKRFACTVYEDVAWCTYEDFAWCTYEDIYLGGETVVLHTPNFKKALTGYYSWTQTQGSGFNKYIKQEV
tara:strand:- start:55 stop:375 length:321 start_codon:yes stop_codon:yes gene_type:complete